MERGPRGGREGGRTGGSTSERRAGGDGQPVVPCADLVGSREGGVHGGGEYTFRLRHIETGAGELPVDRALRAGGRAGGDARAALRSWPLPGAGRGGGARAGRARH